jgi:hypothetical protein
MITVVGRAALQTGGGGGGAVQLLLSAQLPSLLQVAVTRPVYPAGQDVLHWSVNMAGTPQVPLPHVMLAVVLLMTMVVGGRLAHTASKNNKDSSLWL